MTHVPTVIISRTAAALAGLGKRVEVPTKLGSVTLIKPLGEGGMSVVHLGRHEILQKNVAVKFLLDIPASENDPRFTAFIEGARAAAAIQHEGLNVIYHADSVQGLPYLVMELIEGPSLADLLTRHGAMPVGVACGIMERVCDAVGELHHHGIIHRDIKPANIMIDPSGRVIVTDFGLAMERPAAHFGGSVGTLAGTPAYMAPEMFDSTVSTRTDVYAIGVTLFELLTGKPPFAGDFQEMRFAHRTTPMPVAPLAGRGVPEGLISGVPEGLIVVIERALHKDVLFRPKSARHVLDALVKACDAAGIRRADVAKIQRFIEIGPGAENMPTTGATPTPKYYERLGTLAEVKRRTPDGTIVAEPAAPTPVIAPPKAKAPEAPVVTAPAGGQAAPVARRRSWRGLPIPPAIAIPVVAVLGAIGLSFIYHLVLAMYDQFVLFYERMNWLKADPSHGYPVGDRIVTGRMSWPLSVVANLAPGIVGFVAPFALLWYPYVRLALSRPPRDGVTRCAWCRHPLTGIRDLRCPECGRLATSRAEEVGEIPVANRWGTHIKYYAVAGAVLIVTLLLWFVPYVWIVRAAVGDGHTTDTLVLFGLLLPATTASLLALHFFARPTSWLTGTTYCGKCGGDLCAATGPQCPGCGEQI